MIRVRLQRYGKRWEESKECVAAVSAPDRGAKDDWWGAKTPPNVSLRIPVVAACPAVLWKQKSVHARSHYRSWVCPRWIFRSYLCRKKPWPEIFGLWRFRNDRLSPGGRWLHEHKAFLVLRAQLIGWLAGNYESGLSASLR